MNRVDSEFFVRDDPKTVATAALCFKAARAAAFSSCRLANLKSSSSNGGGGYIGGASSQDTLRICASDSFGADDAAALCFNADRAATCSYRCLSNLKSSSLVEWCARVFISTFAPRTSCKFDRVESTAVALVCSFSAATSAAGTSFSLCPDRLAECTTTSSSSIFTLGPARLRGAGVIAAARVGESDASRCSFKYDVDPGCLCLFALWLSDGRRTLFLRVAASELLMR